MAWSKSTRISIMLGIDILFFLLELTVGFMVHSLALMADAFHMLNDIISLIVGLWAFKIAGKATTDKYSYGWLRAEILGAFFNAVFLIALCVSIILEALTRFIEPPEIENPKLILIVGSLGLASNLVGFLVLGGHGHAHGPGDHSHGEHDHAHAHGDEMSRAEEGAGGIESYDGDQDARRTQTEEPDTFPEAAVARFKTNDRCRSIVSIPRGRDKRRAGSVRHGRLHSIEDITIHPASFRQEIIEASRPRVEDESGSESNTEDGYVDSGDPDEDTPLLKNGNAGKGPGHNTKRSASRRSRRNSNGIHHHHNHNKPRKANKGGHGHSHDDMGMNAMILHVLGDALGNVGVIATALIIWLTDWPGKLYADPAVSLFITLIILRSAIPLTIAASKILLQATPDNIDPNEVREDIQALPGVISCHHIHIWQLSDTKIVASMHIEVSFPISEAGGEKYMDLAKMARKCLHAYGIHSATIQPEFCLDRAHDHAEDVAMQVDGGVDIVRPAKKTASVERNMCLLECVDNCVGQGCCTAASTAGSVSTSSPPAHSHHDHDHDHGHDHDHDPDHDHDHNHDH
ncbi:cation efflux protein [Thozetella sp. PMI_491]|nr:cation efflux protein [Thozetella sp. PMI_491]